MDWSKVPEIKIKEEGELVEKLYEPAEFEALLLDAAEECRGWSAERYCEQPLPSSYLFFIPTRNFHVNLNLEWERLPVPADCIHTAAQATAILVREDGYHLSDIHLSPVAVTDQHTVIEVTWSIYGWTNRVLVGHSRFPNPPFILAGPILPISYRHGDPLPRIKLPYLDILESDGAESEESVGR